MYILLEDGKFLTLIFTQFGHSSSCSVDWTWHIISPPYVDLNFDAIFCANVKWPPSKPIPRVAHFVHAGVKELTWLDWAAVRVAVANLGGEKVNI